MLFATFVTVPLLIIVNCVSEACGDSLNNVTNMSSLTRTHGSPTKIPILLPNNIKKKAPLNDSVIDWENDFKKCGKSVEPCVHHRQNDRNDSNTIKIGDSDLKPNSNETAEPRSKRKVRHQHDSPMSFLLTPHLCRCDENCTKFGDCCAAILTERLKKVPEDPHYRCANLLDSVNCQLIELLSFICMHLYVF